MTPVLHHRCAPWIWAQKDLAPVFTSCRCVATVAYLAQDVKALYIHFRVPDGATASLNVSKGP